MKWERTETGEMSNALGTPTGRRYYSVVRSGAKYRAEYVDLIAGHDKTDRGVVIPVPSFEPAGKRAAIAACERHYQETAR